MISKTADRNPNHTSISVWYFYLQAIKGRTTSADLVSLAYSSLLSSFHSTLKAIMNSLSTADLDVIKKQSFYEGSEFYQSNDQKQHKNESFVYNDDELPYNPLGK